jgi:hypothetical protein
LQELGLAMTPTRKEPPSGFPTHSYWRLPNWRGVWNGDRAINTAERTRDVRFELRFLAPYRELA